MKNPRWMIWLLIFAALLAGCLAVRFLLGEDATIGFAIGAAFASLLALLTDWLVRPKPKTPPRPYGKPIDPFR